jgi:hypothetical protein
MGKQGIAGLRTRITPPQSQSTVRIAVFFAAAALLAVAAITQAAEMADGPRVNPAADDRLPTTSPPTDSSVVEPDEELDEVLVTGQQRARNRDYIVLWLLRLEGRFRNEGTLQWGGKTRPVEGDTDCISVGTGPGMNCVITLLAPGIETNLRPGSYILGVDLETSKVRYASVDSTGAAVGTTGELRGDTATFRTPCEASSARSCVSTTRITATGRSENVRLRVDLEMDGRVTTRYDVTQVRVKIPN